MNLNTIRPKNETEDFLFSITKNYETRAKKTIGKQKKHQNSSLPHQKETLRFKPLILIEGSWMLGLTSLKVYNSIFNLKITNLNFIQITLTSFHLRVRS